MYKIYDAIFTPPGVLYETYGVPFMLERDKWQLVDNPNDADLIMCIDEDSSKYPAINLARKDQVVVIMDLWHMDNHTDTVKHLVDKTEQTKQDKQVLYVHSNRRSKSDQRFAYYDIMFNRTKAYFCDFDKIDRPYQKLWTLGTNKEVYRLDPIQKTNNPKKFMSPMRVYGAGARMERRRQLLGVLQEYSWCGMMNDPSKNIYFDANSVDDTITPGVRKPDGGTWYPIANKYYEDSYASIYVETVTEMNFVHCITEKSLDPFIKGHFVIPFSNLQYIKILKEDYGFKFPDWIDYTYDERGNDELRFQHFLYSVRQYLAIPDEELKRLYERDKHILEHNRNLILTRPYDSLYNSVKNAIEFNGYTLPKTI